MVAHAVSAIAGNTPRLNALGAALLFVRFPATVDVPVSVVDARDTGCVACQNVPETGCVACQKVPVTPMVVLLKATVPLTTQGEVLCVTATVPVMVVEASDTTHGDVP